MSVDSDEYKNPNLLTFFEGGQKQNFAKGELVLRGDEDPSGVYYIVDGFIKVYSINEQGEEYIHVLYSTSEVFPLTWIYKIFHQNTFYQAMSDCVLLRMERSLVQEAIESDIKVSSAMALQAIKQYGVYADRIDNLEYKFARERLVYRLLFLASRFGERNKDGSYTIKAPVTQQSIAGSINLSRETVSREFERLETKGLVAFKNRQVVVKDIPKLGQEFKEPISPRWWGLV